MLGAGDHGDGNIAYKYGSGQILLLFCIAQETSHLLGISPGAGRHECVEAICRHGIAVGIHIGGTGSIGGVVNHNCKTRLCLLCKNSRRR